MKKIISLLLALCLALSVTVSMAALSGDTFTPDKHSATIETNSTDSQAKTGDAWYWNNLFDGNISKEDAKITETYATFAIHPDKNESAWITVDMESAYEFSGIRLYKRLGWDTQAVTKGYLHLSDDGKSWVRTDLQSFIKDDRYADFKAVFGGKEMNVSARFIKVEAVEVGGSADQQHWGMEELELINKKSGAVKKVSDLKAYAVNTKSDGTNANSSASSSASGSTSSSSESEVITLESAKFTIESDAPDAKVGDGWYWDKLNDNIYSKGETKVTETYAQYSIYPEKNQSAWIIADLGEVKSFSGVRLYNRLGWPLQSITKGYIYVSDEGVDYVRSDLLTFGKDDRYADIKLIFGGKETVVSAKFIKIEAVEVGGASSQQHWGMEEFQLLAPAAGAKAVSVSSLSKYKAEGKAPAAVDENENKVNNYTVLTGKSDWTVSVSSQISEWNGVKALFDGNKDTFWHSYYTAENGQVTYKEPGPYEINVTFPEKTVISGLIYQPRSSSGGTITKMEVYAADSDEGELSLLTTFVMSGDTGIKTNELFANITVKKLMLKAVETLSGVGTGAEIDFIAKREGLEEASIKDYSKIEEENKLYDVDTKYFKITSDVPVWAGHEVSSMLDGGGNSFWQTEVTDFPVSFDIDMVTEQEISKIDMLPRQSADLHGNWKSFEIWAGNSLDDLVMVYKEENSPKSLDKKIVDLRDAPVKARYLRFVINSTHVPGRASMAELYFYQSKAAKDAASAASYEKYVLKIDEKSMTVTKGSSTYVKELDVAPYIYPGKGTTLIPLRGLVEEMGGTVEWVDETQEIYITAPTGKIEMQVQKKTVYSEHPNYGMIRYTLSVAPKIKDSRTFIPLRFVSEHMGYTVEWNGDTREITIEKK